MKHMTDITIVLDRSGSMASCKDAMEEALNGYLFDQKKLKADEVRFTLVKFDDQYEVAFKDKGPNDVPHITIEPRGFTALLDAVGKTVSDKGMQLASMAESERPDKVIIVVLTDGHENRSKEYKDPQRIFDMITHQRDKYGWTFMFLGADIDAIGTASQLGISVNNAFNFSSVQGGRSSVGSGFIAKKMSMGTRDVREEKTSGGILNEKLSKLSSEDTDMEYAVAYSDQDGGALKDFNTTEEKKKKKSKDVS